MKDFNRSVFYFSQDKNKILRTIGDQSLVKGSN